MTFMNRDDPAEPRLDGWPTWAAVLAILVIGAMVAISLLYSGGGSLFGLEFVWARALVVGAMMGISALTWWLARRGRGQMA